MRTLLIFLLGIGFSSAHANVSDYSYANNSGAQGQLMIKDVPNSYGEEVVRLTLPAGVTYETRNVSGNSETYQVSFDGGDTGASYSAMIAFGQAYQDILDIYEFEDFKKEFHEVNSKCGEKHSGFILIYDDVAETQSGYCLERTN